MARRIGFRFVFACVLCGIGLITASFPTSAQTPTPIPTNPPTTPQATSPLLAVSPTPLQAVPTLPPITESAPPPIDITLPDGWTRAYFTVPTRDQFSQRPLNVALYRGSITTSANTGRATIIVLWNFPSFAPIPTAILPGTPTPTGTPGLEFMQRALYSDGVRFLQGTVFDISCNVGIFGQTPLSIGEVESIGSYFGVNGCTNEPDTAGWFVGTQQYNMSFLFFVFIEPTTAYNDLRGSLQAVLDTVIFNDPRAGTPTPQPTTAP
jgi:hypothetical protein